MALAGLILGYAGLAFFLLLILVILPDLVGHRQYHPAASAVGSLRTINVAEVTYYAEYPTRGYSATLAQLGNPTPNTQPGPEAAGLIDPALASGQKHDYRFTYAASPANERGLRTTYTVRADPKTPDSGTRHFFTDETGVIRSERGKPAGPNSPPLD